MFGLSKPQPKAQAGAKLAQQLNQAPDSIPGMFKPGEFVLPPDTVHAMGGKQALQGVVDATHTPVQPSFGLNAARASVPSAKEAPGLGLKRKSLLAPGPEDAPRLGLKPEVFFNNGGAPEDQLRTGARAPVSPNNTFPQASPSAGANIYAGAGLSRDQFGSSGRIAQVPASIGQQAGRQAPAPAAQAPTAQAAAPVASPVSTPAATPAPASATPGAPAPAATRTPGASELYMQDRAQEMSDQWGAGNYAQASGTAGRTAVQGLGMYGLELADKAITPVGNAIGGFAKGLFGINDAQAAPTPAAAAPVAAPAVKPGTGATPASAPAVATATAPAAQTASSSPVATSSIAATGQAAPATAPAASALPTGVYNHGRGQYSDQAVGMGLPAGFTGKPNAQNMAAAENLSAAKSNAAGSAQAEEQGFGLIAPSVAHSGNDWGARQRLKNLETSASSIMNTERWGGRGASHNPAVQNFLDASRADLAAQGKVPDMQLKTNEINAGLKRTAMAEAGADRRATLAESGASSRAAGQLGLGLRRLSLDQQRASSEDRLREPQIRAAERQGQLQEAYLNAKTQGERDAIASQMRAYSGKEDQPNRFTVVPGGQEWDTKANVMRNVPASVLNNRTGQFVERGAPLLPPGMKQVGTSDGKPVYEDAKGNRFAGE